MPKQHSSDQTPPRHNDTATPEVTAQDSDEDRLPSNPTNDIPIGSQIPLQVGQNDSLRRQESVPGLFSFFSNSDSSLCPKTQRNNQSSEAMLDTDYHPNYGHSHHQDNPPMCNDKETKPVASDHTQPMEKRPILRRLMEGIKGLTSVWTGRRIQLAPRRRVVANVAFADALHTENPSPVGRGMFKLYFFLFIAFLNALSNGYDSSLMGGINNMPLYQK